MSKVFILHSKSEKDRDFLDRLKQVFQALPPAMKADVWDENSLIPGTFVENSVLKSLKDSSIVLMLVSTELLAEQAENQNSIFNAGINTLNINNKDIIPFMIRPTIIKGHPFLNDVVFFTSTITREKYWNSMDEVEKDQLLIELVELIVERLVIKSAESNLNIHEEPNSQFLIPRIMNQFVGLPQIHHLILIEDGVIAYEAECYQKVWEQHTFLRQQILNKRIEISRDFAIAFAKTMNELDKQFADAIDSLDQGDMYRVAYDLEQGAIFLGKITKRNILVGIILTQTNIDDVFRQFGELIDKIRIEMGRQPLHSGSLVK